MPFQRTRHDAAVTFAVRTETGWDPPSRKALGWGYFRAVMETLSAAVGMAPSATDPAQAEPRWRVVLFDDERPIARSRWSRDWPHAEALVAQWHERIESLPATEVRSQAHRWNSE